MNSKPVLARLPEIDFPERFDGSVAQDNDAIVWDASSGALIAQAPGVMAQIPIQFGWGDKSTVVLATADASLVSPWAGTIVSWTAWTDDAVNVTADFDIQRSVAVDPPVFSSLVGAGTKPFLTAQRWRTSAPTGWTSVTIAAGDIIAPAVNTTDGVAKSLRLQLLIQRT